MSRGRPSIKKTIKKSKAVSKKEESLGSYGERSTLWRFLCKGKEEEWIIKNPPPIKTQEDLNRENIKKFVFKSGAEHSIVKESKHVKNMEKIYIDCEQTPPQSPECQKPKESEQHEEELRQDSKQDLKQDSKQELRQTQELSPSSQDAEEYEQAKGYESSKENKEDHDISGKEKEVEDDLMNDSSEEIQPEHNHLNEKIETKEVLKPKQVLMDDLKHSIAKQPEKNDPDYEIWKWCIDAYSVEEKFSSLRNKQDSDLFYCNTDTVLHPTFSHELSVGRNQLTSSRNELFVLNEGEEKKEKEKDEEKDKEKDKESSQNYRLPIGEEIPSTEDDPFVMEADNELFLNNLHLYGHDEPPLERENTVENKCILCKVDIGVMNPRQYCGKTQCIQYGIV